LAGFCGLNVAENQSVYAASERLEVKISATPKSAEYALADLFRTARTQHILVSYKDEGLIRLETIQSILSLPGTPVLFKENDQIDSKRTTGARIQAPMKRLSSYTRSVL
jgi:adenine-specific DNA methylase